MWTGKTRHGTGIGSMAPGMVPGMDLNDQAVVCYLTPMHYGFFTSSEESISPEESMLEITFHVALMFISLIPPNCR